MSHHMLRHTGPTQGLTGARARSFCSSFVSSKRALSIQGKQRSSQYTPSNLSHIDISDV
jgi:hypothetical protein